LAFKGAIKDLMDDSWKKIQERKLRESKSAEHDISRRDVSVCLEQFELFHSLLMSSAPEGYIPWIIPCAKGGKDIDYIPIMKKDPASKGSWKHPSARMSKEEAINLIKQGYNIGLVAMENDALINIDIDDKKYQNQVPKDTLTNASRKRDGRHAFCWNSKKDCKINIPTGDYGELRANNQYVLIAGSYVEVDEKIKSELSEEALNDPLLGYYSVINPVPPREITWEEIPQIFKDKQRQNIELEAEVKERTEQNNEKKFVEREGKYDDLFALKMSDIVGHLKANKRVGHPLHSSDTDANFSVGTSGDLAHCWRHGVSLNAVQFLCVEAGYASCEDAGTPHRGGMSKIKGDKKALQVAYEEAIKKGLIREKVVERRVAPEPVAGVVALPEFELPKNGKLISSFINDIAPILARSNVLFFRPDERAVVKIDEIPLGDGSRKAIGFKVVSPQDFVTELERYIVPVTRLWDDKEKYWVVRPKSLNVEIAKVILASEKLKNELPIILSLYDIPMPVLSNGVLRIPKTGYDPDLKSWLNPKSPTLKLDMSLEEAKKIILDLVDEFCFESPQDKVNAISAILTPFLRGLYSRTTCRTPIMFWKANRERAGKDYGAGMTGIIYYGESIDDTPIVSDGKVNDEEFRKKILSVFKIGRNRYHSANNKGYLNSAQLENLATTENFTDRALGSNLTLTFPNTLELSLSANTGITYTPDIAKRCLFIKLFLELEDPNTRQFKNSDLHGWIRSHRSEIISALYTFVRVWYSEGMPKGDTPFASFPEWADVCGGIMKACGLGDPCIPNQELITVGGDNETADMKSLFEWANKAYGDVWKTKKEIMNDLSSLDELSDLFGWLDLNMPSGRTKFGILFEKFVGRIFSGIQMIKLEGSGRGRSQFKFSTKKQSQLTDTLVTLDTVYNPVNKNVEFSNIYIESERVSTVARVSVEGVTPVAPSESLSFEQLQSLLLDFPSSMVDVDRVFGWGFSEVQIEQWLKEGLLFSPRSGFIGLLD
jgi:putative DNA primase/helicase